MELFCLDDIVEKRWRTIAANFLNISIGINTPTKNELMILGSPLSPIPQADFLKKITKQWTGQRLENCWKMDAQYVFYCRKSAWVCQSCASWEPVKVLIIQLSWKRMPKLYATVSPKCVTWIRQIFHTQLALLAEIGGLWVSFASLLAPSAILTSAFGASDFLTTICSDTFEHVLFKKALEFD